MGGGITPGRLITRRELPGGSLGDLQRKEYVDWRTIVGEKSLFVDRTVAKLNQRIASLSEQRDCLVYNSPTLSKITSKLDSLLHDVYMSAYHIGDRPLTVKYEPSSMNSTSLTFTAYMPDPIEFMSHVLKKAGKYGFDSWNEPNTSVLMLVDRESKILVSVLPMRFEPRQ